MKITREFINANKTKSGGFNKKQIEALGEEWPPISGWVDRAALRDHEQSNVDAFVTFSGQDRKNDSIACTRIYCDGSCEPNPGPGGWGVWVESTGREAFGGEAVTTNNRMEMQALIEALKLAPSEACTILTDSQYCVNGANVWRHKWERNGWKRGRNGDEVKNPDLWRVIAALMASKPHAIIQWVRGHNGDPGNEKADDLAGQGRWQIEKLKGFA